MKNIKTTILSVATWMLATLTIVSCVDKNDWDVDSSYNRLFSITSMSVSANATDIKYTFSTNSKAEYYLIELSKDSLYEAIALGQHESSIIYGEDKSITKSPVTLGDLDSDTKYFLRVKAMSTTSQNSGWAYLTDYSFKTKSEQIITDITSGVFNVSIQWPANSKVTHVVVLNGSTTVVSQNLTTDEIAKGEVVVEGLESRTDYTIKLMNGTLTRGSKTFRTNIDTGDKIKIYPEDDIAAILANAEDGNEYAILPGTYVVSQKITLTKSISIMAAVPNEIVVQGMYFDLTEGVGLELRDLILDGSPVEQGNASQLIKYTSVHTTGETNPLVVSGCQIRNYTAGFIDQRVMIEVKSMTITNNTFDNIGARFIDIQQGYSKVIDLTNNTISNSVTSDAFIRIDNNAGSFSNVKCLLTISNNTLYRVYANGNNRFLYVRQNGNQIVVRKNLITHSTGGYSDQSATNVTVMANNYYHSAPNYLSGTKVNDTTGTVADPQFKDVDNLDFTIQNRDVANAEVGDPRWFQ